MKTGVLLAFSLFIIYSLYRSSTHTLLGEGIEGGSPHHSLLGRFTRRHLPYAPVCSFCPAVDWSRSHVSVADTLSSFYACADDIDIFYACLLPSSTTFPRIPTAASPFPFGNLGFANANANDDCLYDSAVIL